MDDGGAYDQLRSLLDLPSAETRYGAFRALWAMNPEDAVIKGETLGGFNYHVLSTAGPPMIHVTRSLRPEIVVFGHEQCLRTPLAIEAGNNILINAGEEEKITISRFVIGPARPETCRLKQSRRRDPGNRRVGRDLSRRGAGIATSQTAHALSGRLEVDAIPSGGVSTTARMAAKVKPRTGQRTDRSGQSNPRIVFFETVEELAVLR